MCGPHRHFVPLLPRTLRRIPQAVGTVTLSLLFSLPFSQGLEMCGPHRRFAPLLPRTLRRIPQAVGTVVTTTTTTSTQITVVYIGGFNTASGKYYYFITFVFPSLRSGTRDVRALSSLRSPAVSPPSSHTASGRCCYFITFVFPSFQSGTRDVRTSSSLCSSAASHPSSHTTSGRYCCNWR